MNCLKILCAVPFIKKVIANTFTVHDSRLVKTVCGLAFKNPVGLGAGFDKNAKYLRELETLGFGFVEIGTVTPRPQAGNDKPRLFRLPTDKALINRMGFNNDGVEAVTHRLKKWRKNDDRRQMTDDSRKAIPSSVIRHPSSMLIGGNIGKNKATPNEEAWKDYEICFRALHPFVDFFVVNVSSPNTPGLRELQEKESLRKILTHLQAMNKTFSQQRPILLKIAPDLTQEQIDDVIALATEINLDGLVATNTTISREGLTTHDSQLTTIGAGGLSGKPLKQRSTEVLQYLVEKTNRKIPVIGSGGIFSGKDAKEKMLAGASLVEVWTGFIYEGPMIVKRICRTLA
ncbi:quinone-dependent dihydroorotate dehydrogenase [Flavisolibacter ginsenosidimutans]